MKDLTTEKKLKLAWDYSTSAATLAELAMDKDWLVRQGVAGNESASRETLALLAGDEDADVRMAVAGNLSAPREVLAPLALWDRNRCVRHTAAENLAFIRRRET